MTAQIEKQEREITQLQKKLENEVAQKHLLGRNQDVSTRLSYFILCLHVFSIGASIGEA